MCARIDDIRHWQTAAGSVSSSAAVAIDPSSSFKFQWYQQRAIFVAGDAYRAVTACSQPALCYVYLPEQEQPAIKSVLLP